MSSRPPQDIYTETLAVFTANDDPYEPLTAPEVADAIDANRRTVYKRLKKLVERGELETKEVGSRARVWWRPPPDDSKESKRRPDGQGDALQQEWDGMYERINGSVYVLDDEWRFIYLNERAERLFGSSEKELRGLTIWEAFPETVEMSVYENYHEAMEMQGAVRFIEYYPSLDRWFEFLAHPSENILTVYLHDVTDHKEREQELERYEAIIEALGDPVYALDTQGRFTFVNQALTERSGYDESELLGQHVTVGMDEEDIARTASVIADLLDDDSETSATVGYEVITKDGERIQTENHLSLLTDQDGRLRGSAGVLRDVTDLKQRERELERYETIVETVTDGIVVVDADARIRAVNDAVVEMTGYPREKLVNAPASSIRPDDLDDRMHEVQAALDAGADTEVVETMIQPAAAEPFPSLTHFARILLDDSTSGRVGVIRDISDQVNRERELEESEQRYRTLVDNFPNGAVALVNEDLEYITVGGTPIEEADVTVEELEGSPLQEILPPAVVDAFVPRYRAAFEGESSTFENTFGDRHYRISILPVHDESGDVFAALGMSQDITERKEYEEELEKRIHQLEVITDFGQQALENRDVDALMAAAARHVADTLDNDYCKVLDLDADAQELLLRQGVGWTDGIIGSMTISAIEDNSQAAHTLASEHPIVVENLETESRFSDPELLTSHDVRSGISTIVGPYDDPWGILGTHDTEHKEFSRHDVNFVQSVANILATAITRHDDEQKLAHQREHLAALNNLNTVVREIIDAVIEQSTREEIEQVVCEQLAASDSYKFAWIAETGRRTTEITPRAEAGIENFLERIELSADPDEQIGQGPAGKTFRSGEMQVSQNIFDDPAFESWHHFAEKDGFRSFASIPIIHDGTLFGVVGIYSERADAFAEEERELIGQLGEIIGHAIAATEQKRALLSDDIVELTFQTRSIFETLDLPDSVDGTVTLDRTVPISDDAFLMYGTATGVGRDTIRAFVEAETVPHWESVHILQTEDEKTRFEVRLIEPPVVSALAARGGYIHEATIEDGDLFMTIHLAPSTDVSRVVETIKAIYPDTEMVTRQQVTRSDPSLYRIRRELSNRLTERQQTALEAAYQSGFFDWPRISSGEEIARSLDIGSSTFHQHLRKAEKQLLNVVFAET